MWMAGFMDFWKRIATDFSHSYFSFLVVKQQA